MSSGIYLSPFEKPALIHGQGESSWTNEAKMIAKMKKKAAEIGANGIILGKINEPSTGAQRRGEVIAIRIREAPQP